MKNYLVVVFALISNHVFCQQEFNPAVTPAKGIYSFTHFSTEEGLCGNNIEVIEQDSRGYVWVGTRSGFSILDGQNIVSFSEDEGLIFNSVHDFLEDKNGLMWIATDKGLSCFDGKKFTNYTHKDPPSNQIWCLAEHPEKGILMGTSFGIDILSNGKWENFLDIDTVMSERTMIRSLNYDSKGNLWAGTQFELYRIDQNLAKEKISDGYVFIAFAEEKNGSLWFGGWSNFLMKYQNGKTEKYYLPTPINDISIDSKGTFWLATWDRGLLRVDDPAHITEFNVSQGLSLTSLWTVHADHEDNIWAGTYGTGISLLTDQKFSQINETNGLINSLVNSVVQDTSSNIWAATEGGVTCLKNDGTYFHFTEKDGLNNPRARDILLDHQHHIWFILYGGRDGIMEFDGKNLNKYELGSGFNLEQLSDSSFWFGTDGGGATVVKNYQQIKSYRKGINNERAFSVFEDSKKRVWLGMERYAWYVVENDSLYHDLFLPYHNTRAGTSICEDSKGGIWINLANKGIYLCDFNEGKITLKDSLQKKDGLLSTEIAGMLFEDSVIWINTAKGLSKFYVNQYYQSGEKRFTHFEQKDGFKGEGSATPYRLNDNSLAVGTTKGLMLLNEKYAGKIPSPPITVIRDIKLFQEEIDWEEKGIELSSFENFPKGIKLPYNENHLTFLINGISFNHPELVQYKYILEGFDQTWSVPANRNEVVYSNIPPGEYIFKVKSANKDGLWDESPAELKIIITPPFWQTWWFRLLIVLMILTLFWFFQRWRNQKLIRDKKNLEEQVKIRTVQLDNAFQEIRQKNEEITDSISYAKRIQKAILPPSRIAKKLLGDNFIFYRPKDIVAGDFYWLNEKNNMTLCAVADCTGHGVPGAMVSVVCNSALNRAIREFELTNPADILNKVRELVIETFAQSEEEVKDGMDITLISLQKNSISNEIELNYAGANNPLWIFRKGKTEIPVTDKITTEYFENNDWTLIELKPDKQPVGKFINEKPFSNINFKIHKDDLVYLFSDGFADQFGGEKGKKMKNTNFKTILMQNLNLEMDSQMKEIEKEFIKWRGDFEQLDDICVVGVKF